VLPLLLLLLLMLVVVWRRQRQLPVRAAGSLAPKRRQLLLGP
jgi:hypothetical protein